MDQDSLVVANNGDGNISLFQPGDNGLALSSVLSSSGLPNPSGAGAGQFQRRQSGILRDDRR